MTKFEKIKATINLMYPKVKIKQKKDLWLFKLLKKTTGTSFSIGNNLILGREEPDILIHELQHWFDRRKEGSISWYYDYLSPQIYSILWILTGILAAYFGAWIAGGICAIEAILCLLPVESSHRTELEERAYFAGMWTSYQFNRSEYNLKHYAEYIARSMSSKLYYKMCSKETAEFIAARMIDDIHSGEHHEILEAVNVVLTSGVIDEL